MIPDKVNVVIVPFGALGLTNCFSVIVIAKVRECSTTKR